jgi:muramoyltetrapeptide carboxypeptidase
MKEIIIPPFLKKGDTVAIVATARKVLSEEMDFALNLLSGWGLKVVKGKHLFSLNNQFAGTDEERLEDINNAINNPDVKAVFCARGGYGTVKIVDKIDYSGLINSPKWIVGYSDITVLHSHLLKNNNIASIHATMPINFAENTKESLAALKSALFGLPLSYDFPSSKYYKEGIGKGLVVGGNLSILYSLSGTVSDINTDGKILFLEDLDEYLYHIDRMMMNLKRSGKLSKLKGLVVGGMTEMKDNTVPFGKSAEEIIFDAVKDYNYPVCFGFPAGHIKDNRAIYIGMNAKLEVSNNSCRLLYTTD